MTQAGQIFEAFRFYPYISLTVPVFFKMYNSKILYNYCKRVKIYLLAFKI